MITGTITVDREAIVALSVYGTTETLRVESVLDTGFNGYLTLSNAEIAALGLSFQSQILVTLADGSELILREFMATVEWDGQQRDVLVLEAEGGSLLGMSMLYGYDVHLRVLDGAFVTIQAVP